MNNKIFALLLGACVAVTVHGAPLYDQSFDYGGSTLDFGSDLSGDGWSDNTGVIDYEPSSGLSYADYTGASGGSLVYSHATTGDRNAQQAMSYDFAVDAAGEEYWVFALGRVNTALSTGGFTEMRFDGGSSVNTLGFGITDTGIYGTAWTTTPNAQTDVSGGTYTVGDTIGFLAKITKGTGASPENTVVNFWFNPDLTNLGAADASITDAKFGREGASNALDTAYYGGNTSGSYTWDEVVFTKDFGDIYTIPEPSTFVLIGIALGSVLLFRRKR